MPQRHPANGCRCSGSRCGSSATTHKHHTTHALSRSRSRLGSGLSRSRLSHRLSSRLGRLISCRILNGILVSVVSLLVVISQAESCRNLLVSLIVVWQFLANLILVEGAVKGREEEHHHLGTHTHKKHKVAARQVSQFEQRTKNYD